MCKLLNLIHTSAVLSSSLSAEILDHDIPGLAHMFKYACAIP